MGNIRGNTVITRLKFAWVIFTWLIDLFDRVTTSDALYTSSKLNIFTFEGVSPLNQLNGWISLEGAVYNSALVILLRQFFYDNFRQKYGDFSQMCVLKNVLLVRNIL